MIRHELTDKADCVNAEVVVAPDSEAPGWVGEPATSVVSEAADSTTIAVKQHITQ